MSEDKPGVPASPVVTKNLPSARFNLGAMVERTVFANCVKGIAIQKGVKETVTFFEGLLAGYNDWFAILKISQDVFDSIQEKLDKKEIVDRAEKFVNDVIVKESKRLVLPSGNEGLRVAKEMFDQKIKLGG